MHQPVPILVDEASTEQNVSGGTLTSTPVDKFLTTQYMDDLNVDELVDLPFFERSFIFSESSTMDSVITNFDPFFNIGTQDPGEGEATAYPLVALSSCHFYDYDIEMTFMAIKHERARGRIQFLWNPVHLTGFSAGSINSKFQKFIWDLELNDTFTLMLKGSKVTNWRSHRNIHISDKIVSPTRGGNLQLRVNVPYDAANVGPTDCEILVFYRLVNLRTAEYTPPWSCDPDEGTVNY